MVWRGLKPGVYESWKECERQVKGAEGAVYKAFGSREEADAAFAADWRDFIRKRNKPPVVRDRQGIILPSLSVDAACSGNPGALEYRGVDTGTGREIFSAGPFPLGTVNIGEFLAIVHALALLKKHGSELPVYSDSKTAIKWVSVKAVKTKLPRTAETGALFEMVDRAVAWLNANDYSTKILKWNTERWGEIPADYGRK